MSRRLKCGCDPTRNGDWVYLGPGEGPKHQQAVDEARQSFLRLRQPDIVIGCPYHLTCKQSVMRSDLVRESPRVARYFAQTPRLTELVLDHPVTPQHLGKLADFLFTGDYAVTEKDVATYRADMTNRKMRCKTCASHYRLLCLHLGMFQTGRYLQAEMLQLLAMDRFAQAVESASALVLKFAVEDVYCMESLCAPDGQGPPFTLAGFRDFRPLMVIPAVVRQIMQHRTGLQWVRGVETGGFRMLSGPNVSKDPTEEFEELRLWSARFSHDLAKGLVIAYQPVY